MRGERRIVGYDDRPFELLLQDVVGFIEGRKREGLAARLVILWP